MYKILIASVLISSSALAQQLGPDTDPGQLFLVDIDGERVVYQAGFDKIWYPQLSDMFGMTLAEQLDFIEQLEYAGIRDWRIGYYWDTTPLKWSIFGHVRHPGGNAAEGYNTSVYFPYTSETIRDGQTVYYTHGRTGDEWGDPQSSGSGAIISMGPIERFALPDSGRYASRGVPIPAALAEDQPDSIFAPAYPDGSPRTFYTLARSEAQDHWSCGANEICTFNEDLNFTPDYLPFCLQAVPQVRDCGAWTVTEAIPQLWVPNGDFHEISISAASQPEGRLSPVNLVGVWQDEMTDSADPDVIVSETDGATVVQLRADRDDGGDGRVYHIVFNDAGKEYAFNVGVPNIINNRHQLADGGRLFRSDR